MNRRNFLQAGAFGFGSLTLGNISFAKEKQLNKSVILIWLGGGISDIDFINPLPLAPVEIRSNRGHIVTPIGEIGSDFKEMGKLAKDLTIVRSFHHRDANHESASYWVMTSEMNFNNKQDTWPSPGSLISQQYGFVNGTVPRYVQTSKIEGDGPAWLGVSNVGYRTDLEGINNLNPNLAIERMKRRVDLTKIIEKDKSHLPSNWPDLRDKSLGLIYGDTSKALNLNLESDEVKQKYRIANSRFGRDCLLARRLVQHGCNFVTVANNGWDHHDGIYNAFGNKAPELDYVVATLINDLKTSGLLDKTLVVITSEFGRTFRINQNSGRDHKAAVNSLIFAGGGANHGKILGTTDSKGSVVEELPLNPKDLNWTIGNYFGLDKQLVLHDNVQRPRPMFESNAKNILEL